MNSSRAVPGKWGLRVLAHIRWAWVSWARPLHEHFTGCLDHRDEGGQGPHSRGAQSLRGMTGSYFPAVKERTRRDQWDFHGQSLALLASSTFAMTPNM